MALKELNVLVPNSADGDMVIAFKCSDEIGMGTVIHSADGYSCFANINGRFVDLMSGRTVWDSYYSVTNRKMGLQERQNAKIAVYSYKNVINNCSVGINVTTEDVADGSEKSLGGYWEYSLEVVDRSNLVELINEGRGVATRDDCIIVMNKKGGIRDITESVVMSVLKTTPFSKFRGELSSVSKMVINEFLDRRCDISTGLKITAFTLGDMRVTSKDETDRPAPARSNSTYGATSAGGRFGGALNNYGTGIRQVLGDSVNVNAEPVRSNDVCDVIDIVEKATVEINCQTLKGAFGGTGFLVTDRGSNYLMTNMHVVEDVLKGGGIIAVRFSSKINPRNDKYMATVYAIDPVNDLAILDVQFELPAKAAPLKLADMSTLRKGEAVVSVGNPREFTFNAIQGNIANENISMGDFRMSGVLCTLAAAAGNSGGAVVRTSDCAVIGVATAIKHPEYMQGHTICVSADAIRQIIYKSNK